LYEVPATGGAPAPITTVKNPKVESDRLPYFLPDGRHLLFAAWGVAGNGAPSGGQGIFLLNLDTKKVEPLLEEASNVVYAPPGYLLYYHQGYLMAQPFDLAGLRTTGPAAAIAQGVAYNMYRWAAQFSVSGTGLLVYLTGATTPKSQLTWFDLGGKELGTAGTPASFDAAAISPDGRRAILTEADENQQLSLWLMDFNRGVRSRFVLNRDGANSGVWSPDGNQVAYDDAEGRIYLKPSNGSASSRALSTASGEVGEYVSSWSPDGRLLAFGSQVGAGNWHIGIQPVTPGSKPSIFLSGPGNRIGGSFSPDGRWIAYLSDESGKEELYVAAFPGPGGKWQVSNGGAAQGGWMGKIWKLFYVTPERHLMAVDVTAHGGNLAFAKSEEIFGGKPLPGIWPSHLMPNASWITGDGKRLLLPVPVGKSGPSKIDLIANWSAKLKQQ
jgi:dipeptidyl aminopeptidase/acylaminoacyl peptidase